MNKDDGWAEWYSGAAPLFQPIPPPVGVLDRLGYDARTLLIQQRHAIGEAIYLNLLVARQPSAVDDADLHQERIAGVHPGIPGHRRSVELWSYLLQDVLQALADELVANG